MNWVCECCGRDVKLGVDGKFFDNCVYCHECMGLQKKYYVELVWAYGEESYAMQSEWFDTKEEALRWTRKINYVNENYDAFLMSAEWKEDGTYGDIVKEEKLAI